jgi:hypothetical protein
MTPLAGGPSLRCPSEEAGRRQPAPASHREDYWGASLFGRSRGGDLARD